MATKSSTSKKRAQTAAKTKRDDATGRYIASVVLFALAILLFCLAVVEGEAVWAFLHRAWLGLAGFSAYLWPLAMLYAAVMLARDKDRATALRHGISAGVLLMTAQALVDVFLHGEADISFWKYLVQCYEAGAKGSGFVGGLIGHSLCALLGTTGAKIVILLVAFVMLMLMTGTTLIALFRGVSKPAKRIKEVAESAFEAREAVDTEKELPLRASNRHPYDIAIEGEDPVNAEPVKPMDLKKQGRKVVDAFRGNEIEQVVPSVGENDFSDGELRSAEAEETAAELDGIVEGLADNLTVVSDDKPVRDNDRIHSESEEDFRVERAEEEDETYVFPPIDLLNKAVEDNEADIRAEQAANAEKLVDTLRSFGVETRILHISRGPSVTRYELQPAAGVRISRIANLTDDIALSLATSGVRIEAPIPNKAAVGIEVPNKARGSVNIRSLIESPGFRSSKSKLTGVLGKDITGEDCFMDIAKMPHILIAGTTGSGKSVCLNSLILSILYKADPNDVKLLMIDPKAVEMKVYNGIPHLLVPVVTDPKKAAGALGWAVNEMLRRYQLLSEYDVRNLAGYNERAAMEEGLEPLPQIVIFIDEFADLMMAAPGEVEDSVCRLAQMARAAGMHLVIATQSPRADVITGLIKSNIPSRIALKVANALESRIILDMQGAERLIGNGDMLYSPTGANKPIRIQGCWVSDAEIKAVTDFLKGKTPVQYDNTIVEEIERQAALSKQGKKNAAEEDEEPEDEDPLLDRALECVVEAGQASTSMLQRKLKLGYSRAARIMDQLESHRYIGPAEGAKPRAVLISPAQLLEMKASGELHSS